MAQPDGGLVPLGHGRDASDPHRRLGHRRAGARRAENSRGGLGAAGSCETFGATPPGEAYGAAAAAVVASSQAGASCTQAATHEQVVGAASAREQALFAELDELRDSHVKKNEEVLGMRERLGVLQAELKQQLHGGAQLQAQAEARKDQLNELKENVDQSRQVPAYNSPLRAAGSDRASTATCLFAVPIHPRLPSSRCRLTRAPTAN